MKKNEFNLKKMVKHNVYKKKTTFTKTYAQHNAHHFSSHKPLAASQLLVAVLMWAQTSAGGFG